MVKVLQVIKVSNIAYLLTNAARYTIPTPWEAHSCYHMALYLISVPGKGFSDEDPGTKSRFLLLVWSGEPRTDICSRWFNVKNHLVLAYMTICWISFWIILANSPVHVLKTISKVNGRVHNSNLYKANKNTSSSNTRTVNNHEPCTLTYWTFLYPFWWPRKTLELRLLSITYVK